MRVTARLFGVLREKAGVGEVILDLREGSRAAEVPAALANEFPQIVPFVNAAAFAVNTSYVKGDQALAEGDEVALLPPVSGGATSHWMHVTEEVLNPALIRTHVQLPEYGAVATFEGMVRQENLGRKIEYLEYEAYAPMAEAEMERIIAEARGKWGAISAAIHHRTGRLEVGELSIVVVVGAPHRAEAFDACEYIVDQVKERVPIWKREVWEGGAEWIGSPEEETASP